MRVEFQRKQMEFPTAQFGYLRDSTEALADIDELRRRIAADGYLFIRGLIDRDAVLEARRVVMEHLREQHALVEGTPLMEGVMPRDGRSVGMKRVAYRPEVLRVLEGPELQSFYRRFYGEEPATFDHKWLRAVGEREVHRLAHGRGVHGPGQRAREHRVDPVRGYPDRAGHAGRVRGIAPPGQLRQGAGDGTAGPTWIVTAPRAGSARIRKRSATGSVAAGSPPTLRAGDIVTFGLYTLHGSTNNTTNRFRISCDVRYQPASEPMDARWGGDSPTGHYGTAAIPMADARKRWGL